MDTYDIDYIDESGGEWTHTTRYKALREENARLREEQKRMVTYHSEKMAALRQRVGELERLNAGWEDEVERCRAERDAAEAKLANSEEERKWLEAQIRDLEAKQVQPVGGSDSHSTRYRDLLVGHAVNHPGSCCVRTLLGLDILGKPL